MERGRTDRRDWPHLAAVGAIVLAAALPAAGCGGGGGDGYVPPEPQANVACSDEPSLPPDGCDGCHGTPPDTAAHPPNPKCWRCHGYVIGPDYAFVDESRHMDGTKDSAFGCTSCHGWQNDASPPENLEALCGRGSRGVGAHEAMRRGSIEAHQTGCVNCHLVPVDNFSEGHIDGGNRAEVRFAFLATAAGAEPVFDGKSCSGVYCHGATLTGGFLKNPGWYDVSGRPGECGACHRLTDPQGNAGVACHPCHPTTVGTDEKLLNRGDHINGVIDLAPGLETEE